MESRHPLYDPRNTVTLSQPGERNRERRRQRVADGTAPLKLMPYEPKVAMTGVCRFCGMEFQDSRAICPYCITCQYCGLIPSGSRDCEFCGNHDLDKPKNPRKRIKRGPQRSQEPRKIESRNVRRSKPVRVRERPGRSH